jgi:hypothetical protein
VTAPLRIGILGAARETAFSTWDVFLRAAGSARAMHDGLGRDLDVCYVDMSLSESARRDLGPTVSSRSGRIEGADIA